MDQNYFKLVEPLQYLEDRDRLRVVFEVTYDTANHLGLMLTVLRKNIPEANRYYLWSQTNTPTKDRGIVRVIITMVISYQVMR